MAKKPIPLPVPVEEPPEEDCPKCPPVGAPAWMATFADMATLLMAFFVLILSFAEFNSPKFKMIAGSLKNAFGVQQEMPVVEQPRGTTTLELKFSPSPSMTVTQELKQQTTEVEKKKVETTQKDGETDSQDVANVSQEVAQELVDALTEALKSGMVQAEVKDGAVTLDFQGFEGSSPEEAKQKMAEQFAEAAEAIDQAEEKTGQDGEDVQLSGLADDLRQLSQSLSEANEGGDQPNSGGNSPSMESLQNAGVSESRLQVALQQEIAQGLVEIEQRDDKVFVTVGAGGAFPSGSADLTQEAREIMSRIAFSAMTDAGQITVTGHTDNVPLSASSPLRDNWGLGAARAASVVREFGGSGLIDPTRLTAQSMGESKPVADNDTAEGREKNRRIEIEISY
ncbi:MAG: OmpA family protein [Pseudomonadota bacterium]|nr:OmpA family protein [Pseudomonadota bacterium]